MRRKWTLTPFLRRRFYAVGVSPLIRFKKPCGTAVTLTPFLATEEGMHRRDREVGSEL